jgi:hypothetical protein
VPSRKKWWYYEGYSYPKIWLALKHVQT